MDLLDLFVLVMGGFFGFLAGTDHGRSQLLRELKKRGKISYDEY